MKNSIVLTIEAKRAMLDVIKEMLDKLDYLEKDNTQVYGVIGVSDRQRKRHLKDSEGKYLKDESGEYLYEYIYDDNGEPEYEDEYGYIEYNEAEATDTQKAYKMACDTMRKALEKMI